MSLYAVRRKRDGALWCREYVPDKTGLLMEPRFLFACVEEDDPRVEKVWREKAEEMVSENESDYEIMRVVSL